MPGVLFIVPTMEKGDEFKFTKKDVLEILMEFGEQLKRGECEEDLIGKLGILREVIKLTIEEGLSKQTLLATIVGMEQVRRLQLQRGGMNMEADCRSLPQRARSI